MAASVSLFHPPWYKASKLGGFIHYTIEITESLLKRFWEKVQKTESCWIWTAYKNRQGYGRIGISAGKCVNAHRISWVIHNSPVPEDKFICHRCDNSSCVNPEHLFVGTRQENINDMMVKKRSKHFNGQEYYGVKWEERCDGPNRKGRWRSFIYVNGKMKKLAAHTSILEAARNYDRVAYIKHGERERLNFPNEYVSDLGEGG